jgi:two-component system LytT family response regulator
MIKAILIDDEADALEMLEWQLRTHFPHVEVLAMCNTADKGIEAIKSLQPAIVFLDIEMPVKNGFEVLQAFPAPTFEVFFTTAYNQFAIKAIKFAAFDYLLKPVDTDDLRAALDRFAQKNAQSIEERVRLLLAQYQPAASSPTHVSGSGRIALSTAEGMIMIKPEALVRCQSISNYTKVFLSDGHHHVVSKTLKEVEETLPGTDFYRVHHSHLINLNHIRQYVKHDGGYLIMSDGETITIARNRKDGFMQLFARL